MKKVNIVLRARFRSNTKGNYFVVPVAYVHDLRVGGLYVLECTEVKERK